MRTRLLLVAGLLVCVGLLCLFVWFRHAEVPNQINHRTFEKIEKGMTREAVVELLGVPPGDYVTQDLEFVRPVGERLIEDAFLPARDGETEEGWAGNGGKVTVWFGPGGTVGRRSGPPPS